MGSLRPPVGLSAAVAVELHRRASGRKRLELIDGADHSVWTIGAQHIPAIMAEMMGTGAADSAPR